MDTSSPGQFLAMIRRRRNQSLQDVANRIGTKGLSKQALSLIENSRMKIPSLRLHELKSAYALSRSEEMEFDRLVKAERLILDTDLDREFGKAVLSLVDQAEPNSVYVIGGRALALTSPVLRSKAAEFLQNKENRLLFIYPDAEKLSTQSGSLLWYPNSEREITGLREAIQEHSKRFIGQQIQFHRIDVMGTAHDILLLQALSLCGPFTVMTIAASRKTADVTGYVYVEGPKDRWVLLKPEHSRKALTLITRLLERDGDARAGKITAA
jgi:transcriptional regulator with XRE-family HTH domain